MDDLRLSRDSRDGKFRGLPHFPAIPAAPIGGGELAGGNLRAWLLRLAGAIASLGTFF